MPGDIVLAPQPIHRKRGNRLLWVDATTKSSAGRYSQRIRQHVMLNYLEKQAKFERASKSPQACSSVVDKGAGCIMSKQHGGVASEERCATGRVELRDITVEAINRPESYTKNFKWSIPSPVAALCSDTDRKVYQAAWFHTRSSHSDKLQSQLNWKDQCKLVWNRGFWEGSRNDPTLMKMFLAYGAAKATVVTGSQQCQDYYLHKGEAMALVNQDLQKEGKSLRLGVILAISMLCKAAFIEGEYQTAETHVRAISALVSDGLAEMPSFLWTPIVWADLRLTSVSYRAPVLPYILHKDFQVSLPARIRLRAKTLAAFNVQFLPCTDGFPEEQATTLLENMYSYTAAYCEDGLDWRAVWSVSYQTAYLLAQMQNKIQSTHHKSSRRNCNMAQAFLLCVAIQFWGTSSAFVPQDGPQRHLLRQLMMSLRRTPETLCEQWHDAGCLDSYLWVLFNAGASTIQQVRAGLSPSASVLAWIRSALGIVMQKLEIYTCAQFEKYLRRWPYAEDWNGRVGNLIFDWAQGSPLPVTTPTQLPTKLFRELRLTFDVVEEKGVS